MIQSVVSRMAVVSGVTLALLSLPVILLSSGEIGMFKKQSVATTALINQENSTNEAKQQLEGPVVQLASLSLGGIKPNLDIVDFSISGPHSANQFIELASDLAKQRKFEEALATLEKVQSSERNNHGVKFLEARILSWHGKYDRAEQEFETLRAQYPHDMDVLVSYGYLHFYQRNYVEAEALFVEVLGNNPDYHDARHGLERSRTAHNKNSLK